MTEVVSIVRFVNNLRPCSIIIRHLYDIALISLRGSGETCSTAYSYSRAKVVEVALYSIDVCRLAKVYRDVLTCITGLGTPVCHEVLVDSIPGNVILECRRNLNALLV